MVSTKTRDCSVDGKRFAEMIETFVANLANLLPFGYAFGAGMVTTVSPCAIAMLPAYVSLHLEERDEGFWGKSSLRRGLRTLALGSVVTFGTGDGGGPYPDSLDKQHQLP